MHLLELAAQLLEGGAGYQSAQGFLGHAGLVDWQWRSIEGRGALQLDDTAADVRGGRASRQVADTRKRPQVTR